MVNFNKYKEKKEKKESEKRASLLKELNQINMEIIKTKIPDQSGNISYTMTKKIKQNEINKLKRISSRVNEEARNIRDKWEKEGFDPFLEQVYCRKI